jgi:hypothetical protein
MTTLGLRRFLVELHYPLTSLMFSLIEEVLPRGGPAE